MARTLLTRDVYSVAVPVVSRQGRRNSMLESVLERKTRARACVCVCVLTPTSEVF